MPEQRPTITPQVISIAMSALGRFLPFKTLPPQRLLLRVKRSERSDTRVIQRLLSPDERNGARLWSFSATHTYARLNDKQSPQTPLDQDFPKNEVRHYSASATSDPVNASCDVADFPEKSRLRE